MDSREHHKTTQGGVVQLWIKQMSCLTMPIGNKGRMRVYGSHQVPVEKKTKCFYIMCDTWFTHSKAQGSWAEAGLALRSQPQQAIWEGLHFVPADLTLSSYQETRVGDSYQKRGPRYSKTVPWSTLCPLKREKTSFPHDGHQIAQFVRIPYSLAVW